MRSAIQDGRHERRERFYAATKYMRNTLHLGTQSPSHINKAASNPGAFCSAVHDRRLRPTALMERRYSRPGRSAHSFFESPVVAVTSFSHSSSTALWPSLS